MNSSMIPILIAILFGGWAFLSFIGSERGYRSNAKRAEQLRSPAPRTETAPPAPAPTVKPLVPKLAAAKPPVDKK